MRAPILRSNMGGYGSDFDGRGLRSVVDGEVVVSNNHGSSDRPPFDRIRKDDPALSGRVEDPLDDRARLQVGPSECEVGRSAKRDWKEVSVGFISGYGFGHFGPEHQEAATRRVTPLLRKFAGVVQVREQDEGRR